MDKFEPFKLWMLSLLTVVCQYTAVVCFSLFAWQASATGDIDKSCSDFLRSTSAPGIRAVRSFSNALERIWRTEILQIVAAARHQLGLNPKFIYRGVKSSLLHLPAWVTPQNAGQVHQSIIQIEDGIFKIASLRSDPSKWEELGSPDRELALLFHYVWIAKRLSGSGAPFNIYESYSRDWATPLGSGHLMADLTRKPFTPEDKLARYVDEIENTGFLIRIPPPASSNYNVDNGPSIEFEGLGIETWVPNFRTADAMENSIFRVYYRGLWYKPQEIESIWRPTNNVSQKILNIFFESTKNSQIDIVQLMKMIKACVETEGT